MNKVAYTCFVAFWASLVTLLVVGVLARPAAGPAVDPAADPARGEAGPAPGEPAAASAEPPADEEALRPISREELARHDSRESCWKAIHGKVYDVTDYLDDHPTPPSVMLAWCGRESTEGWETKGYGRPHSAMAEEMLEAYLVGRLAGAGPEPSTGVGKRPSRPQ